MVKRTNNPIKVSKRPEDISPRKIFEWKVARMSSNPNSSVAHRDIKGDNYFGKTCQYLCRLNVYLGFDPMMPILGVHSRDKFMNQRVKERSLWLCSQ